ncbi:hypothetical protein [Sinorhizobium meliloti]|uniref:hypothetical protein n=1 Tax=Rhizobium meliloti TaxID=382 RepID=UPI000FDB8283|nr:hypothetical protein [Sinorhizobium meliloti]MDX1247537.1 hypothetical protein [Sinorhizobium medicae]RVL26615.1 hypothetical protein CN144_23220 [Sinorhizobium meliloti]
MITFLLYSETGGKHPQEYVLQYLPAEMEEIFTPHERLWLAEGKIVERDIRGGKATYIDMGVAARKLHKETYK